MPIDLNQVFKANSTEAIWQLLLPTGQYATDDGKIFILNTGPTVCSISNQLLNAFELNDKRKSNWIGTYTSGTSSWSFPYKYKDNSINTISLTAPREYTMMFRLAEQYLIRSEARAQQNNITGALADLNVIRNRAGLSNYNGPTDQQNLISAIAHERQVELFTEGDRWLDIKRLDLIDPVMSIVTPLKGGAVWNSYQQYYPVPRSDTQNDNNLSQTPGY